jgi:hypothetical protein
VIVLAICFWSLSQGVDVLTKTAELKHWYSKDIVLLALFFYAFVLWYSSRALSWQHKDLVLSNIAKVVIKQLPRLMGYYVYAIFYISYLNSPLVLAHGINSLAFYVLLFFFLMLYILLVKIFSWKASASSNQLGIYKNIFRINIALILLGGFIPSIYCFLFVVPVLIVLFVFLVINRDAYFETLPLKSLPPVLKKVFANAKIGERENRMFTIFNIFSFIAFCIYVLAAFNLRFSITIGSLAVVLLALAIIGGSINLLKMFSALFNINFIFFLVVLMFVGGLIFKSQSHKIDLTRLQGDEADKAVFQNRQGFYEYLSNWINAHQYAFEHDSIVPMIFVLADGGASRSGYWTASVLGKMEDETKDSLSKYLFCLSGASGGSVGNATFFSLLFVRNNPIFLNKKMEDGQMVHYAQEYLQTDFLSYTLARMLGPGFGINSIVPIFPDRANALEHALDYGADTALLDSVLATGFSQMITHHYNPNYHLPILCINTTQMQDATPGVISNIKIDSITKERIDVLSLIQPGNDIALSTAVITGARFPYVTPAGLIAENRNDTMYYHYFVDGGYFDNSGAGIVQEMIQKIEALKKDSSNKINLSKLRYVVIHITNSSNDNTKLTKIHPFKNDIAAPLVTLMGSYGTQTTVNDSRLENYLNDLYKNDSALHRYGLDAYCKINLYRTDTLEKIPNAPKESYPMSWSISNKVLDSMKARLKDQPKLKTVIEGLNKFFESRAGKEEVMNNK